MACVTVILYKQANKLILLQQNWQFNLYASITVAFYYENALQMTIAQFFPQVAVWRMTFPCIPCTRTLTANVMNRPMLDFRELKISSLT